MAHTANYPRKVTIPPPLRGTRLRVGPLCRCATSPHTVGSHPLHKGGFALGRRGEHCSPARSYGAAKLPGRTLFAPTAHIRRFVGGGVLDAPASARISRADIESAPTNCQKKQQKIEIANNSTIECWPRAGANPSALGFLGARLRSVRAKREPKRP